MRADRLLSIILLLQQRERLTAAQLSAELNVSKRTIYRDIDVLSASGVPIYADGGPGGGYGLLDNYRTTLTGLNENEVEALFTLAVPSQLTDLASTYHLKAAFLKLAAALPSQRANPIEQTNQRLYLDSSGWFTPTEATPHLQTLQTAVWQDNNVQLTYARQNDSVNQRLIQPYALAAKSGHWYLVANSDVGMRVYRVSRVLGATIAAATFDRLPDFDLPAFWQNWIVAYESSLSRYRVTIAAAPEAEYRLVHHFGREVEEALRSAEIKNGRKQLNLLFEREEEALAFLLGMGGSVKVIEPVLLQEQIIRTAHAIAASYVS